MTGTDPHAWLAARLFKGVMGDVLTGEQLDKMIRAAHRILDLHRPDMCGRCVRCQVPQSLASEPWPCETIEALANGWGWPG